MNNKKKQIEQARKYNFLQAEITDFLIGQSIAEKVDLEEEEAKGIFSYEDTLENQNEFEKEAKEFIQ